MSDHPPKPRLTLRVGVTGHRPNKLRPPDVARIERQIRDTIGAIEAVVARAYEANKTVYADQPATDPPATTKPYRIRMISGFAEGADQMAIDLCPQDWIIEAILPFPKQEYLKDFERSAADGGDVRDAFLAKLQRAAVVTELPMPDGGPREQGYVLCGSMLLRQIDLLIAVWDGQQPKPGGTGAVVKEAFDGGIPVVWLATGGDHAIALIDSFHNDRPARSTAPWSEQQLQERLDPILAAPPSDWLGVGQAPRARLERFCAERWPRVSRASGFDLLKRWATGQRPLQFALRPESPEALVGRFSRLIEQAPDAGTLSRRLNEAVGPRHAWADALAVQFSHRYRNAYVLSYLLAAAAVLIAVIGAYAGNAVIKLGLVALELVVIVVIIQLVRHGGSSAWHERWIDYRLLAESLRHARFLAYVSEFGLIQRRGVASQSWVIWYIRATLREIGLPGATLDRAYQRRLLQSVLRHEVREQRHWHEANANAMERVDHALHRWADRCFHYTFGALCLGLVFLTVIILLLPEAQEQQALAWVKPGLLLFATGLPALGAALTGIRVQGEFEDAKERSDRMIAELNTLEAAYESQIRRHPRLDRTAEILIETARILSDDLAAWQELYGRKRLDLPA
ncbi:MAG: hypothetical protein IT536_00510 [Hyphomicrobiales bacterium]|nr:hypothetical protein [Hyphomicrobiales bacterium]